MNTFNENLVGVDAMFLKFSARNWRVKADKVTSTLLGVLFFAGCGPGLDGSEQSDADKAKAVADYGKNTPSGGGAVVDVELEAFWAQVPDLIARLPPKKTVRLSQNLRELRARFDRDTAEHILKAVNRLVVGGDLETIAELASFELALLLEQKNAEALVAKLREFYSVSDFAVWVQSIGTVKPVNSVEKQLEEAELILSKSTVSPEFKPKPGNYTAVKEVTISSSTPGAKIYYTLDTTEPTQNSFLYTGPFVIGEKDEFVVIKAKAFADGLEPSDVSLATYNIVLPTASVSSFSKAPGGYRDPIEVSISSSEAQGVIRYTLDGSTPNEFSPVYLSPFVVDAGTDLKLMSRVFAPNKRPSAVSTASYFVDNSAPVLPGDPSFQLTSVKQNEFSLKWNLAADNHDTAANLMYRVYVAKNSSEIDSVEKVSSKTVSCDSGLFPCRSGLIPGVAGIVFTARMLTHSTEYFVAVQVADLTGNSVIYPVQSVQTLAP